MTISNVKIQIKKLIPVTCFTYNYDPSENYFMHFLICKTYRTWNGASFIIEPLFFLYAKIFFVLASVCWYLFFHSFIPLMNTVICYLLTFLTSVAFTSNSYKRWSFNIIMRSSILVGQVVSFKHVHFIKRPYLCCD